MKTRPLLVCWHIFTIAILALLFAKAFNIGWVLGCVLSATVFIAATMEFAKELFRDSDLNMGEISWYSLLNLANIYIISILIDSGAPFGFYVIPLLVITLSILYAADWFKTT